MPSSKFTPDPHLFVRHHPTLRYYDELSLARLKRAAEYYLRESGGLADPYAFKVVQTRMLNGQEFAVFQMFWNNDALYQLLWIPDYSGCTEKR